MKSNCEIKLLMFWGVISIFCVAPCTVYIFIMIIVLYRSSFLGRGQGCCFGGILIFPLSLYETVLFGSLAYLPILWHTCEPLCIYEWMKRRNEVVFLVSQVITESVELYRTVPVVSWNLILVITQSMHPTNVQMTMMSCPARVTK